MAKKQTFTSKLSKKEINFKHVKHIKSVISEESGHVKFLENMVRLEENENLDQALKRIEEDAKQVLSFGEVLEEEPSGKQSKEEAPVEETPVEVSKEEASSKEPTKELPADEVKEENFEKEVSLEEQTKEAAPSEEALTEEPKDETTVEKTTEVAEQATEDQSAEKAEKSSK